jgi:hypothetical protein
MPHFLQDGSKLDINNSDFTEVITMMKLKSSLVINHTTVEPDMSWMTAHKDLSAFIFVEV